MGCFPKALWMLKVYRYFSYEHVMILELKILSLVDLQHTHTHTHTLLPPPHSANTHTHTHTLRWVPPCATVLFKQCFPKSSFAPCSCHFLHAMCIDFSGGTRYAADPLCRRPPLCASSPAPPREVISTGLVFMIFEATNNKYFLPPRRSPATSLAACLLKRESRLYSMKLSGWCTDVNS